MTDLRSLLDDPSPAVMTTYRQDGSAAASPVWFRVLGETLQVVVADHDIKLRHLAKRPESTLLVFEAVPPFRGVRIETAPIQSTDGVEEARRAIARKYLGGESGDRFTDQRGPGVVLSWALQDAKIWDLGAILP